MASGVGRISPATASLAGGSPVISPTVLIRGAGEMASGVAWRLYMANVRRIVMTELDAPLCVRRTVSFSAALDARAAMVEGVEAWACKSRAEIEQAWSAGRIAVVSQAHWNVAGEIAPDVVIDGILAKRNVATKISDAPLVIALGPGFTAGSDCHLVVETNRGHRLGRVIVEGSAEANTGVPGDIAGHTEARVLRAPADGEFVSNKEIGDVVVRSDLIGSVAETPVTAALSGVLRGLIRPGTYVTRGVKIGDIDPRAEREHCYTISDKARAIAGGVLEAMMRHLNAAAFASAAEDADRHAAFDRPR